MCVYIYIVCVCVCVCACARAKIYFSETKLRWTITRLFFSFLNLKRKKERKKERKKMFCVVYFLGDIFSIYNHYHCIVISALFGVLFPHKQEGAFSSYRMFHATGCAIAFGYSYVLCVETKVYILAGVLALALALYSVIEMKVQLQSQYIGDIVALWWTEIRMCYVVSQTKICYHWLLFLKGSKPVLTLLNTIGYSWPLIGTNPIY